MPLSLKKQRLVWVYANPAKKEYLSGNFLIAGHPRTARYPGIKEMIQMESAVGAVLLSLLTPVSRKIDGSRVEHEFRGRWAGDIVISLNNKEDYGKFREITESYHSVNLEGVDYLREQDSWDKPLYDTLVEDFELPRPRPGNLLEQAK